MWLIPEQKFPTFLVDRQAFFGDAGKDSHVQHFSNTYVLKCPHDDNNHTTNWLPESAQRGYKYPTSHDSNVSMSPSPEPATCVRFADMRPSAGGEDLDTF